MYKIVYWKYSITNYVDNDTYLPLLIYWELQIHKS